MNGNYVNSLECTLLNCNFLKTAINFVDYLCIFECTKLFTRESESRSTSLQMK